MGMIERIYGRDGEHRTCYLTRVKLTPTTPLGGLYLHVFHRGDADPAPHDHPWDFWTLPLTTYWEEVLSRTRSIEPHRWELIPRRVEAFRIHHRAAEHAHRVLGRGYELQECGWGYGRRIARPGTVVTLVWHGPKRRTWGFWRNDPDEASRRGFYMRDDRASEELLERYVRGGFIFVHWRDYVYGERNAQEA